MTLSKTDILNALDLPTEEVEVPRWGGTVLVRAMPIASVRYTQFVERGGTLKNPLSEEEKMRRRYVGAVILSALDGATEERLFEWGDAKDIREKHWNSVLLIATKAFDLASDQEDQEEAAAAAEAEAVLAELDLGEDDIIAEPEPELETDEDAPDPPKGE